MAVATGGSEVSFKLDFKFEYAVVDYYQLPIGQVVVSDKFNHNGDVLQLRLKKISQLCKGFVSVDCQLLLVTTKSPKSVKLAQIGVIGSGNARHSPWATFYRSGAKLDYHGGFCDYGVDFKDLKVEVEVLKCHAPIEILTRNPTETQKSEMAAEVLKWFQSEEFGDTTIVAADGQKFRCHRDILARRSPVFRVMFSTPMKESRENRVDIDGYEGEIVASLLSFIYIDDCGEIGSIGVRLYAAADHYQLDRLKILCESALAANLSAKSIVTTMRLAKLHSLNDLLVNCVDYLKSHKYDLSAADLLMEAMDMQ